MSPLEAMAKALVEFENQNGNDAPIDFEYLRSVPFNKYYLHYMGQARAALLALAEADIGQAMINAGFVGDHAAENFADSFRTVLGLIASPEASDD